jgi:hypothetical protein
VSSRPGACRKALGAFGFETKPSAHLGGGDAAVAGVPPARALDASTIVREGIHALNHARFTH